MALWENLNVVKTRWSSVTNKGIKNIHFMKEAHYE